MYKAKRNKKVFKGNFSKSIYTDSSLYLIRFFLFQNVLKVHSEKMIA